MSYQTNLQQNQTFVNIDEQLAGLTISDIFSLFGQPLNGSKMIKSPLNPGEKNASAHIYSNHIFDFSTGTYFPKLAIINGLLNGTWESPKGETWWACIQWAFHAAGLPEVKRDSESQQRYEAAQSISETLEDLLQAIRERPELGIEYVTQRGISKSWAKQHVGYLPRNWEPKDREAGLRAGLYSTNGHFLFADRCIIPIRHYGKIVNFYGRALDPERKPRHIYCSKTTPETPQTIFGIDVFKGNYAFLCESIIDCLSLQAHGFPALGLYGVQSLTPARLQLLKRSQVRHITLVFDMDGESNE
jgi:hypothetical protein